MSAEAELVEALKVIRQENARLQTDNARLRDVVATYPERLNTFGAVLSEIRGLLWQLVGDRGRGRAEGTLDEALDYGLGATGTGIPPIPDERWWPTDNGPTLAVKDETQVQIPEEPEWPRDERETDGA